MPEHALPEAKLLKADLQPGVGDVAAPMAVFRFGLLSLPPVPLQPGLLPCPQEAVGLELPWHPVMHLPPPCVRDIASEFTHCGIVPIAIIVLEAQPWLQAKVVENIEDRGVCAKELSLLHLHFLIVALPEVLQEVHVLGDAVPPCENLIQVTLVSTIVRRDLVDVVHQQLERAVGRLYHHDTGVEECCVVASCSDLWHCEQEVNIPKDKEVSIDEDDLVVVSQLPQPELAVVPLVVSITCSFWVPDSLDYSDLPPCSFQASPVVITYGLINKDNKIPS